MNSPQSLIVFGEDWGAHPSSTQHLIGRLIDQFEVTWVNSIGMRRPKFGRKDAGRVADKLLAMAFGGRASSNEHSAATPQLNCIAPRCVSWPGSSIADIVNRRLLKTQLSQASRAGAAAPILWTSLPTAQPLVGHLGERAVVYYCGDDFGALAGVDHVAVREYENRLVEQSDLILAASERLADRFPADRTKLLPHGVDFELFSKPAQKAEVIQEETKTAGFYGSFSEWIDVELLAFVAKSLGDWEFVFVGPVRIETGELESLKNVKFVEEQPHSCLPSFVQHWTVSILPFRDNAQIRACNPLKLREYLAAGTPIVSTEFPALSPYREYISTAHSAQEFAHAIRRAGECKASRKARSDSVRNESWDSRVEEVAAALFAL